MIILIFHLKFYSTRYENANIDCTYTSAFLQYEKKLGKIDALLSLLQQRCAGFDTEHPIYQKKVQKDMLFLVNVRLFVQNN